MGDLTIRDIETNSVSDGYHTFGELYDHRIELWIALCRELSASRESSEEVPWRSRLHSDGSSFAGWFVLGVGHSQGRQITYHLPLARWEECGFAQTVDKSPDFDGHTPANVLERLKKL